MENIAEAKIHILFYESTDPSENTDLPENALLYFSALRKQKFLCFTNPKVKYQQAAAELTVCAAMKEAGFTFTPPEYAYNELGRPCMKSGFLSISHTNNAAACIVFPKPVGLDIEFERRIDSKLAGRILNSRELSEFAKCENQNEFLIKNWVAKESFLKLTGIGLRNGMQQTDFHIKTGRICGQNGKSCSIMQDKISNFFKKTDKEFPDAMRIYYISLCSETPVKTEIIIYNSFADIIDYLKN